MVGIPQLLVRKSDDNTVESALANCVDDYVIPLEVGT